MEKSHKLAKLLDMGVDKKNVLAVFVAKWQDLKLVSNITRKNTVEKTLTHVTIAIIPAYHQVILNYTRIHTLEKGHTDESCVLSISHRHQLS